MKSLNGGSDRGEGPGSEEPGGQGWGQEVRGQQGEGGSRRQEQKAKSGAPLLYSPPSTTVWSPPAW